MWQAKRALDTGALGVIFPFTSTPELAQQAAASVRYPPNGRRGAGPGLASFRWLGPEAYYDFADRNVTCVVLIEERTAAENIEKIAATPGIDVLYIGTNDLAFSYGKRGNFSDPEVQKAIARIVAAGKKNGKAVGRPAGSPDQVAQYVKEGFTFFQSPADLNMMVAGAQPLLKALGKSGPDPKERPLY
jgi:4-hydroxy-2-oxoheptanedioate aldolase